MMATPRFVDYSIIIPAKDEVQNLPGLIDEIHLAMSGQSYEIIVVDDGSTDGTNDMLVKRMKTDRQLRTLRHPKSTGQSSSIYSGTQRAHGNIVLTLDGDGQDDPAFLLSLAEGFTEPSIALVAGQRVKRQDSWSKKFGSRMANGVRGWLLADETRDTGCGLKAFRRAAFLDLPYFDAMHRFLPALFLSDGWKIAHVDVVNRPRRFGQSKYGNLDRLMIGIIDLFGVAWLRSRRRRSPLAFLRENDE